MRRVALFAALLLASACAASSPDIIQVGPWFSARSAADVQVFYSRDQIAKPWGAIAIIHSERVGARSSEEKLEGLKLQARKSAAGLGADAVIMTVDSAPSGPEMGVYQEPELYLSALAIKYVTEVSTPSAK